jgi:hypothetical protein
MVAAGSALAAFEHAFFETVSLDGEWEMAYRPYEYETVDLPKFKGVKVKNAIPGYWEDMMEDFRAAGMKDEFRINPFHVEQTFPIVNWADDTTLPDIYGCFFYRREITLDSVDKAVLRFEGVRNQVHAWINGGFVAFRAGFSTPFELPVPKHLLKKGKNEIVLAVSNNRNLGYCDYVYGLTSRSIFRSTGGVNGKLELRFLKSDLADVYVTTAKDLKSFTVNVSGKDAYSYEIRDGERLMAKGEASGSFTLPTDGYGFWSPENPKRYELTLKRGGMEAKRKFGIRRLVADGEKFKLNGKRVYLRGITEHCYFAETVHLPRDLDYYRRITAKRKELGFNFLRFHTYVPPAEYLEAMDELGMLVHIESPNFVSTSEYISIIDFARSHPSVVIYCTGNETRIDRIAEAYLEEIARQVHARTDSLFSPMSALRGVEYYLMKGKDAIVNKPFQHDPERMARLARYSDLFTSYQLGLMSYFSLNSAGADVLDKWGDAYCGKPRLSHEICIDGSYVDLSLEEMYPKSSPIRKIGIFSGLREHLRSRGLLDRADTYFRNSSEWMRRIRKFTFEKIRAADRVAGYDFLGDINTHWHTFGYSVGMMDEFFRLKPGETAENALRYNSAAVVLNDLGSDYNFKAGETKKIGFKVSNYDSPAEDAVFDVALVDAKGEKVFSRRLDAGKIPLGEITALGEIEVEFPAAAKPEKYMLEATLASKSFKAQNVWELYAFPKAPAADVSKLKVLSGKVSKQTLMDALAAGERVVLFGAGPFNSLPTTYRIALAGRTSGNLATVVKAGHPALGDMPHEGFCGWQFRRLMEGGSAVQLEAGVPFDPIVDIASAMKCAIRQAGLFEYKVGQGRLLVCSFKFLDSDPAAVWLKGQLLSYAASGKFEPADALTAAELDAVISAPLLSGQRYNANRARNPSDPASSVRADAHAQP